MFGTVGDQMSNDSVECPNCGAQNWSTDADDKTAHCGGCEAEYELRKGGSLGKQTGEGRTFEWRQWAMNQPDGTPEPTEWMPPPASKAEKRKSKRKASPAKAKRIVLGRLV